MSIKFFKTLEDYDYSESIGYGQCELSFSYFDGKEKITLDSKNEDSIYEIKDKDHNWDISKHGAIIRICLKLHNLKLLFGDEGIAPELSTIGIAAICSSTVSDRLEAHKISSFTIDTGELSIDNEISLSGGKYRGNIILKIVLYLLKPGPKNSGFPTQSGTIIGTMSENIIQIFEDSNLFPIYEGEYPGLPLWWVKCQWTDIENDPFIKENVCIIINKANKNYNKIQNDETNKEYEPGYLSEVMSSAIQIIIEKIRNNPSEWSKIMSEHDYPVGSIASTIQYLKTTFEWDFSSPENLARDIRSYVCNTLRC